MKKKNVKIEEKRKKLDKKMEEKKEQKKEAKKKKKMAVEHLMDWRCFCSAPAHCLSDLQDYTSWKPGVSWLHIIVEINQSGQKPLILSRTHTDIPALITYHMAKLIKLITFKGE